MAKLDSIANSKTRLNGNDKNAKEFIAYRAPLGYPLRKGGKSGVQNSASSNDIKNPRTNAQLRKASLANPEIKHSSKELKPLKSK